MGTIKKCLVKNRGVGVVSYQIPEAHIKRSFQPGESREIDYDELVQLAFQPGGRKLMEDYLQIQNADAVKELDLKVELEYNMSEKDVIDLLLNGSLDAFLDALDFGPAAVIDLIKTLSVQLPLESTSKKKALKERTGFDVDKAIANSAPDTEEEATEPTEAPKRRVQPEAKTSGRRTTPKYNIISEEK